MANLETTYMGLTLKNPIVAAASPLSRSVEKIQALAEIGIGAITLFSLFEEQVDQGAAFLDDVIEETQYRYAEHIDFFPEAAAYSCTTDEYLELIHAAKQAVDIPIIASFNGFSNGSWLQYAHTFEQAGADALELNFYYLPTSHHLTGAQVEALYFFVVNHLAPHLEIPIAVKLHPFFSSIPHLAKVLERAGADGLVLFNRFYQPDLDIESLNIKRRLTLSTSAELRLPLRWTAILSGQVHTSLALSTGVHTTEDVIKAIMAGADVVQVCSAILSGGLETIPTLVQGIDNWLDLHSYTSLTQIKGLLSSENNPSPAAFERANYVKLIGQ